MTKLKEYFNRTKYFMQLWEGVWVIPVLSILVFLVAYNITSIYGPDAGEFPPGLVTAVVIGALIVFSGATVSNLLLNLYHRGWFRYYYNTRKNSSLKNDFQRFPKWARIIFVPLLQVFYLLAYVYVVCQLI
jgi:hypothetical protein